MSSGLTSFVVAGLDCGPYFPHDTVATMAGDAMGCGWKIAQRNERETDSVIYLDCAPCYSSGIPAICCGMGCDQETLQRSGTGRGSVTSNAVASVRFEGIHPH